MALQLRTAGRGGSRPAVGDRRRIGPAVLLAAGAVAFVAGFTILVTSLAPMFGWNAVTAGVPADEVLPFASPVSTDNPYTVIAPTPSIPGPKPESTAPAATPVDGVSFELRIPVLGYSAIVHQGVSLAVLDRGPGHYTTTPWPGQHGNVGVAGHNTPWLSLNRLKVGDRIEIRTQHGFFTYQLTGTRIVDPSDRSVLAATHDDRLTLTTCYPLWAGALATKRLIFTAVALGVS